MEFEQFYLGCLSHASYLIGDGGEAAIVDPQRDVDLYIEAAKARGLTIRWVLETHLHADFVSGHRELAERTGATIALGARANAAFPHKALADGDALHVGRVAITVLATPGHTPEGVTYRIDDPDDASAAPRLLTGDTLFVGDVGRPDLVTSKGHTAADMAGMLYDSLQTKILPLPDATTVWPAHGAGSACGRNIGKELHTTLGRERQFNPNLAPTSREEFVRLVTTDLAPAPGYFGFDAEANRVGAPALTALPPPGALLPDAVAAAQAKGAIVLDVRSGNEWCGGHLPGSLNVALQGQFASWSGAVVPHGSRIVLVAGDEDEVAEARLRLARVGLDQVAGYLAGGLAAWAASGRPVDEVGLACPEDLVSEAAGGGAFPLTLDVRRPREFEGDHVWGARNTPLEDALRAGVVSDPAQVLAAFGIAADERRPILIACQSGYRSTIAASIVRRAYKGKLWNLVGGTQAWTLALAASSPDALAAAQAVAGAA